MSAACPTIRQDATFAKEINVGDERREMTERKGPIVPYDADHLTERLTHAASRLGTGTIDPRELEHLAGVITRCSALLDDVYTDERLRAILGDDPRRLAPLVANPWFRLPLGGDLPGVIYRVRRIPDEVREVADQALFDLAITGRSSVRGVNLDDLGPRAYVLAADVLDLLATDAKLREHFVANQMGRALPIEEEVIFLRRCADRFDLYSRLLREAGSSSDENDSSSMLVPAVPEKGGGAESAEARIIATAVSEAETQAPSEELAEEGASPFKTTSSDRDRLLAAYERLLLFANLDLDQVAVDLASSIIDQQEAITALCDDFALYAVGTQSLTRPASYFLVGPTGVGKNYLVETLVSLFEKYWRVEIPLLTIEGPNYTYPSDINELRGATRGFIRSDEPGLLSEFHGRAAEAPLSVILVDEVEKAHPQLRRFFLSIMDRGTTTDAQGNELNFAGALIFFTSNIGYADRKSDSRPIGYHDEDEAESIYQSELTQALKRTLSPEFINRLKLVRFHHLPRSSAELILELEFEKIAVRYRQMHDIDIAMTSAARDHLIDQGYSREYGARHLRALIERHVNVEVGKMLKRDEDNAERDPSALLDFVREIKSGKRPLDAEDLSRRIRDEARARVEYGGILIDVEGEKIVYRRRE